VLLNSAEDQSARDSTCGPKKAIDCRAGASAAQKVRLPIQRLPFDNGPNQRIDIGFPDGG
jgi:hypothetical protein